MNINTEKKRWDKRADNYENPTDGVFSLTKYQFIIDEILGHVKKGTVLDLGCGPTGRMLHALERDGNTAEGVDISEKMLSQTKKSGFAGRLIKDDIRTLTKIEDSYYTSVVSLNSILPPERCDASDILKQCFRVLKNNGILVAIVMSFPYHLRFIKEFQNTIKFDVLNERVWDEGGWQCAFSPESLKAELVEIGFSDIQVQTLVFQEKKAYDDVEKIYGIRLPKHLALEELLIVAVK